MYVYIASISNMSGDCHNYMHPSHVFYLLSSCPFKTKYIMFSFVCILMFYLIIVKFSFYCIYFFPPRLLDILKEVRYKFIACFKVESNNSNIHDTQKIYSRNTYVILKLVLFYVCTLCSN